MEELDYLPGKRGRNIVGCYMLRPFAHPVECCWMLCVLLRQVLAFVQPDSVNFSDKDSLTLKIYN